MLWSHRAFAVHSGSGVEQAGPYNPAGRIGSRGLLPGEEVQLWVKGCVVATLAARPVYPTLLTTCRVAQFGSLGPGLCENSI